MTLDEYDKMKEAAMSEHHSGAEYDDFAAFKIFEKYGATGLSAAEHDQVWVYCTNNDLEVMSDDDVRKLLRCGWYIDEDFGGWYSYV